MRWTVLLAATDPTGYTSAMFEGEVEADSGEAAWEAAKPMQDWTPEKGGFLISRLTSDCGDDHLVIHDNNDPRRCWFGTSVGREPEFVGG